MQCKKKLQEACKAKLCTYNVACTVDTLCKSAHCHTCFHLVVCARYSKWNIGLHHLYIGVTTNTNHQTSATYTTIIPKTHYDVKQTFYFVLRLVFFLIICYINININININIIHINVPHCSRTVPGRDSLPPRLRPDHQRRKQEH